MKLLRMRTLGMFGIGFLAGSAAGRGPWEKAQASMDQIKDKVSGTVDGGSMNGGSQYGSKTSNGIEGQRGGQGQPQMTEM